MPTSLEARVAEMTATFAADLNRLATRDFIREGVVKEAMTSLIWRLYEEMPDQRAALADALENMPDLIKEAMVEDKADRA